MIINVFFGVILDIILIMKVLNFLSLKNILARLKRKIINVFCYENGWTYPVHISHERSKNCKDLLMMTNENKSHYVYIKDFNRFMCNKTKCKN